MTEIWFAAQSNWTQAVIRSSHLKFPCALPLLHAPCLCFVSSWRWDVPGGRHPSSDPQSGRASLHPPAGLRSLSGLPDLCFMSGAEGRSSSSQLHHPTPFSTPPDYCSPLQPLRLWWFSDWGLINLCVLSWPTCPSPGGTAAPPAKRSSQDTTRTASVPVASSARPTRSCECVTAGWCTCLVRSAPFLTLTQSPAGVMGEKNVCMNYKCTRMSYSCSQIDVTIYSQEGAQKKMTKQKTKAYESEN